MFCQKCGNRLQDNAKFCTKCGNQIRPASSDAQTPTGVTETAHALPTGVTGVVQSLPTGVASAVQAVPSKMAGAVQSLPSALTDQIASSMPGETTIGTFAPAISGASEILNPFKTLLYGFKSFGQSLIGLFKNKQWVKVIIAGVIAVAWIVLMILSFNGVNLGILNFLTFAQGGAGRSVFGWVGGLFGKFTFVTSIFALVGGGYKSLGSGFKSLFKGSNFKPANLSLLLIGAGASLMIYQFFAGNAFWTDMLSGFSGALLSVMALGRGNGFLYKLAQSLTAKKSDKTRIANPEKLGALLSGVTYGFTLGATVSLIPFGWLPVILGGACLIAGGVLFIVFAFTRKEVATA